MNKLLLIPLIFQASSLISMQKEQQIEFCEQLEQKLYWIKNENGLQKAKDPVVKQKLQDLIEDLNLMVKNCPKNSKNLEVDLAEFKKLKSINMAIGKHKDSEDKEYHNYCAEAKLIDDRPTVIATENLVKNNSREEIAFAIAHELGHITNGDLKPPLKKDVLLFAKIFASMYMILKGSQICVTNIFNGDLLWALTGATLASVGTYSINNILIAKEKKADLTAAELLGTAEGGIKCFEKSANVTWPPINIKDIDGISARLTHPKAEDRIRYLKEWQKNKNNKKEDL